MTSADKELEEQLLEAGNKLSDPPSSVDELLPLLDRVENCLSRVEQSPTKAMQNALSPSLKALVSDKLVKHSDVDVKVAVASCISEITRITAPDAPYDDDQMKEVFQLIVSSFENLYDKSSPSYTKRTAIVETVAKVRSCVVMLDLECDALILEMFHHFFKAVREHHPESVFSSMEIIMTLVIEESEDISLDLLSPILASVKKDNEEALPLARKLGERVLESCATKLKPYLVQAVSTLGISLDDYSKVLATICQETPGSVEQNDVCTDEHVEDESKTTKEPLQESTQVVKDDAREAPPPEQAKPVDDKSPKSVMSNGIAQAGEDDLLADSKTLKKQEDAEHSDQSKGMNISGNEEPNNLDNDKIDNTKQKPEQASEKKGRTSSSKLAEPSESQAAANEKEADELPDSKSQNKDIPSSPQNDQSVEAVGHSEDKGIDAQASSPKAVEDESEVVASPPSENLPDENRSKKLGRSKKKGSSVKGVAEPTEDDSKKVSEETSDTEAKPAKRTAKKAPVGRSEPTEDDSKKVSEETSGTEAKPTKRTARKAPVGRSEPTKDNSKRVSEETSDTEAKPSKRTAKKAPVGRSESTEDDSKKVSEETSDTEAKPSKRTAKKAPVGRSEPTEDDSKKVSEETSDTEAKPSKRTTKKAPVGRSDPTEDDSKKVSEETSDTEAKPTKRTAKKAPVGRSDRKKTTVIDTPKKGSGTASDPDAKKNSAKRADESDKSVGGSSARQSEDKKKRVRGKAISETKVATSAKDEDKEMLSSPKSGARSTKDEEHSEETPKGNSKRKRTPGKENASDIKEPGEDLVGSRVKVYWPKDRMFYKGVIDSFDSTKKRHKVMYDDGDQENLNLKREKWEFIEDESDSDGEEGSDQQSPEASPNTPPKKKGKAIAGDAIPRGKVDASKSGGGKSSKSKGASTKSGGKSKDSSKVDSKSKISKTAGKSDEEATQKSKDPSPKSGSSKPVDSASKTSVKSKNTDATKKSKSKDEDVSTSKPSAKSKQETPKTGKSKPETSNTASASASKGKPLKSGGKSNVNGSGKVKSVSLKTKEPEKEISGDSTEEEVEDTKGKSASSKAQVSETKTSGKKRRRV